MNRQQKNTATKLIEYLKINKGSLTDDEIKKGVGLGTAHNEFTILGCLEDINLIKKVGNRSYRLTMQGYKFKSFAELKRLRLYKIIKENISFIFNILLVLATIYMTINNDSLKNENNELQEDIQVLKEKQSILETRMDCYFFQLEKLDTNSNKINIKSVK
ncbi:MAG: hypothetical protein A2033_13930 [Bacteroidetes bacterium GWA2_31_9]|nr:MAG: hypothetical protein A2033_13930 [Bacteroidetes bacterium GWA2_31_9]